MVYFILQIYVLKDKIAAFVCSGDLEVQERSSSALALLECLKENPGLAQELVETFDGELNPVAPKAQRKVGIDWKYYACLLSFVNRLFEREIILYYYKLTNYTFYNQEIS